MKPFAFEIEAQHDFVDAMLSLEFARTGYGTRFQTAIRLAFDLIRSQPAIGTRIARTKCRQWIVIGFAYSIVYQELDEVFRIWAIAHHKRKPGYWKKRLHKL